MHLSVPQRRVFGARLRVLSALCCFAANGCGTAGLRGIDEDDGATTASGGLDSTNAQLCSAVGASNARQSRPVLLPQKTVSFPDRGYMKSVSFLPNSRRALVHLVDFPENGPSRERVVEVDSDRGKVVRTVFETPEECRSITPTPDGSRLLASFKSRLSLIELADGSVIRSLEWPQAERMYPDIDSFSDDGHSVFVVWRDKAAKKTQLIRWNMTTGEHEIALSVAADVYRARMVVILIPPGRAVAARRLFVVPGTVGRYVGELPSTALDVDHLAIRDLAAGGSIVRRINARFSRYYRPVFSQDGKRVFAKISYGTELACWNVEDGTLLRKLSNVRLGVGPLAYDPINERLFAQSLSGRSERGIGVMDARELRLIGNLAASGPGIFKLAVAPDGRTLAVGTRDRERAKLLLFDLTTLATDRR